LMRRPLFVGICSIALLLMFSAPQLRADGGGIDTFTFTEQLDSSNTLSVVWQLPASPTPDASVDDIGFISTTDASYFLNGCYQATASNAFLFLSNDTGGGFIDSFLFGLGGVSQLYSGSESNPTFIAGTYGGYDSINLSASGGLMPASLTIATPEPSSLLLLLCGFLALVGTLTLKKVQA
jgi:hypothetical protein